MIRAIFFDWGNTVMYDLDAFQHLGAMVNWPYVKVVPGIEDALRALQPDYRLVIATNAVMSTAGQVRAALARGGLDGYFDGIWTALELCRQAGSGYYTAVLREAGRPGEVVMVGDLVRDRRARREAGGDAGRVVQRRRAAGPAWARASPTR